MQESDLALLTQAARHGGEIAQKFWRASPKTWEKPDGAGPVSEADLAVNDYLADYLCRARPDYGWLSEETDDNENRLGNQKTFIIDPIDGTRSFVAGEETWSLSLAISTQGRVSCGVIFVPVLGKMYTAETGNGAFLNGQKVESSARTEIENATVLSSRPSFDPTFWRNKTPPFTRKYRPSLAYRMALVAEGQFDAMIALRPTWEWDVAAGTIIAQEAGARVSDQNGNPLKFNNPTPLLAGTIAAPHELHLDMLGRLTRLPT